MWWSDQIEIFQAKPGNFFTHLLADLATKSFRETYAPSNTEADLQHYTSRAFSYPALLQEMKQAETTFFVAYLNNDPAGYIQVSKDTEPPECVEEKTSLRIDRLYVLEKFKGKGIGKKLLQRGIDHAKTLDIPSIHLAVWKGNLKAISFYEHQQFTQCGETTWNWGTGKIDEDWWMKKNLDR